MKLIKYILFILIITFSCKSTSEKEKIEVLPQEKLIPVLIDLHKVDGVLSVYSIRRKFKKYDKKDIYDQVLAKHNTTREQVNYSLEYYSDDMEQFEAIFDKLIEELSKLEIPTNIMTLKDEKLALSDNLWNQKENWFLPQDGRQNQIPFSIDIKELGKYTIKAKIKLFSDDRSTNPKLTAYFWYDNGSLEGYRDYFEIELKKSNEIESYTISKRLRDDNVTHLKGWILYNDKVEDFWEKHAEVTNIQVEFQPQKRR